jgi:N-acetylmuramoyl-L-alanine amidase
MGYEINNHFLSQNGARVPFSQTPNGGKIFMPRFAVIHYTAGRTLQSSVSWFKNPAAKASAHLVIGRAGEIMQMQAFNKTCWHAGLSKWKNFRGLNSYAIGIEIDNAGLLQKSEKGVWRSWFGEIYAPEDVLVARHRLGGDVHGWHTYTQKQIDLAFEITLSLHTRYKFDDILGHEDISWPRKTDPGPAFPLQSLKAKILGRA